jgi:hypothetical protein
LIGLDFRKEGPLVDNGEVEKYLSKNGKDRIFATLLDVDFSEFIGRQRKYERTKKRNTLILTIAALVLIVCSILFTAAYNKDPKLVLENTSDVYRDTTGGASPLADNFSLELLVTKDGSIIRGNDSRGIIIKKAGEVKSVKISEGLITSMILANKEKWIVVCGMNTNLLYLYDRANNKVSVFDSTVKDSYFYVAAGSEKWNKIAYGEDHGQCFIYDLATNKRIVVMPPAAGMGRVEIVEFSDYSMNLYVGYHNGKIYQYNLTSQKFDDSVAIQEFVLLNAICATKKGILIGGCLGNSCKYTVVHYSFSKKTTDTLEVASNTIGRILSTPNSDYYITTLWSGEVSLLNIIYGKKVMVYRYT